MTADPLQRKFEQLKLKYGRDKLMKIFVELFNERENAERP